MKKSRLKIPCLLLIFCLILQFSSVTAIGAEESVPILLFGDSSITETVSGEGYSIDGTVLTISADGTYKITGNCASGNIEVKKSLSNVTLILDDLTLTSMTGAPIVVKKSSTVTIHIENTVTLTDGENPEDENSTDTEIADAYEGAAIKVKSGSYVTFCGEGTLNINGNAKNGIKGAATATLEFHDDRTTYNVTAANNGIGSDGSVVIHGGTFNIDAANDGIKSVPESDDTDSTGSVVIYGGTFDITAGGDGIQAETLLKIINGRFVIYTFEGYNVNGTKYYNVNHNLDKDTAGTFDGDTMSCKAIKASGDRTDVTKELYISGGSFNINCSDDAIHSDEYATVVGGTFHIYTGDDGMHADTTLTVGTENGYKRNPDIYIYACFEGLEAGTVNMYSGRSHIIAADDGINAGGGNDSTAGDSFVPGGGRPGMPGGSSSTSSDYNLYIYGGEVYIDCDGDGLDSNGGLYLYGGKANILSMAQGGDNSPFDSDGTWIINGATVFAAGSNGMNESPSSSSQYYYTSRSTYNANAVLNVKSGSTLLHSITLTKKVNYVFYSNPNVSSSVSVSTGALSTCHSTSWEHNWDDGTENTSDGTITYTCTDCGATEVASIADTVSYQCGEEHTVEDPAPSEKYEPGDVNADGNINMFDYLMVKSIYFNKVTPTDEQLERADCNGDGKINMFDYMAIKTLVMG